MASAIGISSAPRIARFDASIAAGEPVAACSASSTARSSSRSGSTTSSTSEMRSASSASMRPCRPSTASRSAFPSPIRGNNVIGSIAVTWPTLTWVSRNDAVADATTTSASAMKCNPAPVHTPLTATIVGSHTSHCSGVTRISSCTLSLTGRGPPRSANAFRSMPVQNARSPAPVMTIARTDRSVLSAVQVARRSS